MNNSQQEIFESNSPFYKKNEFKLSLAVIITFLFLLIELIGGLVSNSLALLADAGHMFQDVFALLLSLFALKLSSKKRTSNYSFGYKRAEVLAAFINGLFLVIISFFLLIEAFARIGKPEVINTQLMFIVSLLGIVANVAMFLLLFKGSHDDLNIKGAFLHVTGDTLGSIGALIASILIALTGNVIFDVLITFFITILISFSAFNLLKQSVRILMEGIPENIDMDSIQNALTGLDGIVSIHDLHIWSTSSKDCFLSGHAVIQSNKNANNMITMINNCLATNFQINHATIQIEHKSHVNNCSSCDSTNTIEI